MMLIPNIVMVAECDKLAGGIADAAITGRCRSVIFLAQIMNRRIELSYDAAGIVCGTVVDNNDFKVTKRLLGDTLQSIADE